MEIVDEILSIYEPFIEKSPKSSDPNSEENTVYPRIPEKKFIQICSEALISLEPLGSLINVSPPVTYVGDVHGNLTNLLQIFHIFGMPPKTRYMFLGDYVDRGAHSIEVISILLSLAIKFPDDVFLIRGNHEFGSVNNVYGFLDEVINSYGSNEAWSMCNKVFGYLPLAAIVGDLVFCVHGGLSPLVTSMSDISDIDLPVQGFENSKLIADLVWSDPDSFVNGYEDNSRGSGVLYGTDAISLFLKSNKLKLIIRGHQCVPNGYSLDCDNTCVTLFSSCNYCRMLQNKSGVIVHSENREMKFYTLHEDSDKGIKPKQTMVISPGQSLGVKVVPKQQQAQSGRRKTYGFSSSSKARITPSGSTGSIQRIALNSLRPSRSTQSSKSVVLESSPNSSPPSKLLPSNSSPNKKASNEKTSPTKKNTTININIHVKEPPATASHDIAFPKTRSLVKSRSSQGFRRTKY